MILYYGSTVVIEKPWIIYSQRLLNFGAGFYTAESRKQAERWVKNQNEAEAIR